MDAYGCQRLAASTLSLVLRRGVHTTCVCPVKYHRYKGYTYTNPDYEKLNYFVDKVDALDYKDPDYLDKMSNVWKEMIYSWKELCLKQDDQHLRTAPADRLPKMDELQPKVGYEDIEELKTAPLSVRRLFSASYGTRADKTDVWKKQLLDMVRRDKLDELHQTDTSLEAQIAYKTAQIRQWQALVDHFKTLHPAVGFPCVFYPVPTLLVDNIRRSVDKRRKLLHQLRRTDIDSFNKLIKKLRIAYQVPVLPEDKPINIRKQWILHHLTRRVELEKEQQLADLAEKYAEARPKFEEFMEQRMKELDEKEAALKARRHEIRQARGQYTGEVKGEYQPNTVGEAAESAVNIYWYMNIDAQKEKAVQ